MEHSSIGVKPNTGARSPLKPHFLDSCTPQHSAARTDFYPSSIAQLKAQTRLIVRLPYWTRCSVRKPDIPKHFRVSIELNK